MSKSIKTANSQAVKSPLTGVAPPADKQFGKPNGNKQGRGFWKKEDTARFKLEQMMKMTEYQLKELITSPDASLFERRIARSLVNENDWKITESMINQVYGWPKQILETKVEKPIPLVDLTDRKKNGDNDSVQEN